MSSHGRRGWSTYREVLIHSTTDGFALPPAPPGERLARVAYASCPGSSATLRPVDVVDDAALEPEGVFSDGWWTVECDGLPTRTFRTFSGARSLSQILVRYGFQNAEGTCIHQGKVQLHYEPATGARPRCSCLPGVPKRLRNATGVPQFYPTSGVCWYAALCWIAFSNASVRRLLCDHMPSDLAALAERCLFAREAAQELRNRLWTEYAVGDDVTLPPEMDGRNGGSELLTMCAKFKVPTVVYSEEDGKIEHASQYATDRRGVRFKIPLPNCASDPHLLMVRFRFGDHKRFPAMRRICLPDGGARYRLIGVFIGQSLCGHQIGVASPTGDWRDWGFGDADLHKDGIGPMFVRFPDKCSWEEWWALWDRILHVTRFGVGRRRTCNMSLHNPPNPNPADRPSKERPSCVGDMSADWVFSNADRCD